MTMTVSTQVNPVATRFAVDSALGSTVQANLLGAPCTLYLVEIDNTANAGAPSYVKLWNALTATVGTTDPALVLYAPAATRVTYALPTGVAFAVGLSVACVTSPGTPGTSPPTSSVPVRLLASV
jgi:hypothetical protein